MVPAEQRGSAREERPLAALLQELGECMTAASDDASINTPHTDSEAIGVRLCSVLVALLNKCVNADRGAFLHLYCKPEHDLAGNVLSAIN